MCVSVAFVKRGRSLLLEVFTRFLNMVTYFSFFKGNKHWRRYEALSSVLSYEMFDLPLSESQANIEKEFSGNNRMLLKMFVRRISSHLQQLKSAVYRSLNELLNIVGLFGIYDWLPLHHADKYRKPLERDQFSLHKMIVVATEFGNIFGIDSQDGRVVWHVYQPRLSPIMINDKRSLPIFVQRSTSHYRYSAQCAVLGENPFCKHDYFLSIQLNGHKRLVVFDPITGSQIAEVNFDVPISLASLLPFESFDGIKGIIFLTNGNDAYVYPRSVDIPVFPDLRSKPVIVVRSSAKSAMVFGYLLKQRQLEDDSTSANAGSSLARWTVEVAWKSLLSTGLKDGDGGRVVDLRLKRLDSDRSVLYKYLNPNLLVALVQSKVHRGEMTLFLLDGVSGEILFAAAKNRLMPPFHLLLCENWILWRAAEAVVILKYLGLAFASESGSHMEIGTQLGQATALLFHVNPSAMV
ncbi:unnamed protein product [Soboliphyme baturini]|uniref:ER membrane protein complex subunit 1 n=1 Tax=Soboliphyme baturini TaxID=241478 RepID=A0A183IUS3_9BILA|nr:unnamed protein product [Soboliphyme baturini]